MGTTFLACEFPLSTPLPCVVNGSFGQPYLSPQCSPSLASVTLAIAVGHSAQSAPVGTTAADSAAPSMDSRLAFVASAATFFRTFKTSPNGRS